MKPQTFIFFGRSGCGKGTQLKLMREYFNKIDSNKEHFSFSTGDGFRDFFLKETYASNLSKKITEGGNLQPLFLTISLWGNSLIDNLKPQMHMFIDGYPRREAESVVLDEALKFFKRDQVIILDIIVSRETSKNRMLKRGRSDDTEENTEVRLDWYDNEVIGAINYLKSEKNYIYIPIDGEGAIESIHSDIINKIESYLN